MASVATQTRQPTAFTRAGNISRHSTQTVGTDQTRAPSKTIAAPRSATFKLKVAIRRLPPGLTENEFQRLIGPEWRPGSGKVDWYKFKAGKMTKDISKPSIPGRAYLNLTKPEFLAQLSSMIKEITFLDSKNTAGDSCLLGPPMIEMSTYGRIPTSKPRKDARQGTIDQDSEFMSFLQGLTNPITKPNPTDANSAEKEASKANAEIVTPLIQFLRDKKASKEKSKDQTSIKTNKQGRTDTKDPKPSAVEKAGGGAKGKTGKEIVPIVGGDKKIVLATKPEKPIRETIKVLSKPNTAVPKSQQGQTALNSKSQASNQENNAPQPPIERKQRKVGAEAKSLLQRDLGIGGGGGSGRRRRGEATSATQAAGKTAAATTATNPTTTIISGVHTCRQSTVNQVNQQGAVPPLGTSISTATATLKAAAATLASKDQTQQNPELATSRRDPINAPKSVSTNNAQAQPMANDSSSGRASASQAFLKHANASQGITEVVLQTAMSAFGNVRRIEIDKKKGFAYVDFSESDSLKKAIAASPVKVAHGSVVVLERKEKPAKQERNGKGGGGQTQVRPAGGASGSSDKATSSMPTPVVVTGTAVSDSTVPDAQTNSPNNTPAGNKANNHRSHRPRGNRGRGSGRNANDKSGNSQQASPQTLQQPQKSNSQAESAPVHENSA